MLEKIFGEKKTIQRKLIIEFIITIILVVIFSIIGYYIFVHREVQEIIEINIKRREEIQSLLHIVSRCIIIIVLNTIIIGGVIIRLASRKMLEPLEKMVQATKEVASGNFDIRLETKRTDEIEDLANNFNYMVKELGNTEYLQKEFIDNVSHEIKTPINSIQGFARLLEDESITNEEKEEYVGIILEESERLLKLSTSILRLSKLQHQEKITKKEQIDLTEQIKKAVVLLEPKWKEKNIKTSFSPNNSYFYGDEDLIFEVWINLIDNAIKFTKDNGKIDIEIEEGEKETIIKVKDNGIGMCKEELEKIYTRFYQIDKSHSGQGSGLRIIYCKENSRAIWWKARSRV